MLSLEMANHNPNPNDPLTDYAQTQRVVLLIDLNPLISLQNPSHFLSSLLCSTKTLLSFPQLSSSLFAFKFFFSSLSPLLSSSKIRSLVPNSPISLSFDHPTPIFSSLSQTLNSLPSFRGELPEGCSPRASCLAASVRQLVHDYAWDPTIRDPVTGTLLNCDPVVVKSNLVVLFSPICASVESLSKFLNVGIDDECFGNVRAFCERFCGVFENVNEAFVKRDIQLSWVDVQCGIHGGSAKIEEDETALGFEFLESGFRNLGWGFCSTACIVLGSALVPFGLIYPKIGISPSSFECDDCVNKVHAQLSLDILDVAQKPLECKFCDLELVELKIFRRNRSNYDVLHIPEIMSLHKLGTELKNKFWGCFGDSVNKIQVKALHKNDALGRFKGSLSDPIIVREVMLKPERDKKENSNNFFADKVLRMIAGESGEFMPRKSAPIWQILLSFLYREGYCALVSVLSPSGSSLMGLLKPFTVSWALLFIIHDGHDFTGANVACFDTRTSNEALQPIKCSDRDGKRSRKKNLKLLEDQTWSSFCAAAVKHSQLELEEIYFSRQCSNSKKLRFLKCWMKQIGKSSSCSLVLEAKPMPPQQDIEKDVDDRLTESHQESQQPICSASAGENSLAVASRFPDAAADDSHLETHETFLSNLSSKIQQGLESEAVELGALARRLVNLAISWLKRKCDTETNSESQIPVPKSQDSAGGSVGPELLKLLLRDPKDLITKGRNSDTLSQAPDVSASDKIIREYELQILFRMEILQLEFGESIGESMKQKFVKQICSLLETIQCHLEGGFFGDWSLDNYVGKIIKSRYSDTLEDVVNRIYKRMDLLLFSADEDELPDRFLHSEESNQSLREKPDKDESGENLGVGEPVSTQESLHPRDNDNDNETHVEHARKLNEAQERRERARRVTSFTSWLPDLQRVWAPKQTKAAKPKSNPQRKMSKRKKRAEGLNDTVCETPMTENKRSHSRNSYDSNEDDRDRDYSSQSCPSVSKALFQDEP